MLWILGIGLITVIVFGPRWWATHVLTRYARDEEDFPGTGGELARHLLDRFGLSDVGVEVAPPQIGDHYDPIARRVRLSESNHDRRTLTGVVTAAHEVGHALQHGEGYAPLLWRTRLARFGHHFERIASVALLAAPVLAALSHLPAVGFVAIGLGVLAMAIPVLVHLVTLPVEWHASFKRALPLLASGYIDARHLPAARRILLACALTYVAAALARLFNLWQWLRLLRR